MLPVLVERACVSVGSDKIELLLMFLINAHCSCHQSEYSITVFTLCSGRTIQCTNYAGVGQQV